mmetsp:Transcript_57652/g.126336  ORF Transcript_57652/g.126336 Transcript_57652/m.126336 type:complete len:97 (-) Transcript_57652:121-411(-)
MSILVLHLLHTLNSGRMIGTRFGKSSARRTPPNFLATGQVFDLLLSLSAAEAHHISSNPREAKSRQICGPPSLDSGVGHQSTRLTTLDRIHPMRGH